MRYSKKQLLKLRSGQGVWRVLIHVGSNNKLTGTVTREVVIGKKVYSPFRHHATNAVIYTPVQMVCRRVENEAISGRTFNPNRETIAVFLADLEGDGAFSKRTQAVRYLNEVLSGLHPKVEESIRFLEEMDKMFYYPQDDYSDEDLMPDEGDGIGEE